MDKVELIVNDIFDQVVPKHITSKEIDILGKLRLVETKTQDLLEMRENIMKYGDLNLLKDVKDLENLLDRTRKNVKLQRKREEEKDEKIKKQLKSSFILINLFRSTKSRKTKRISIFYFHKFIGICWEKTSIPSH